MVINILLKKQAIVKDGLKNKYIMIIHLRVWYPNMVSEKKKMIVFLEIYIKCFNIFLIYI
jgi:hypothetical protein